MQSLCSSCMFLVDLFLTARLSLETHGPAVVLRISYLYFVVEGFILLQFFLIWFLIILYYTRVRLAFILSTMAAWCVLTMLGEKSLFKLDTVLYVVDVFWCHTSGARGCKWRWMRNPSVSVIQSMLLVNLRIVPDARVDQVLLLPTHLPETRQTLSTKPLNSSLAVVKVAQLHPGQQSQRQDEEAYHDE